MAYKVKLDIFEGPLDLLLYLIQKSELDIHDIPITLITEQYLEYLNLMRSMNLEVAGEFLVMASMLMRIKSKMLLPAEQKEEMLADEGDPREELMRQLLEYKRFKEAASHLRDREIERSASFFRHPEPIEIDGGDSPFVDVSVFDLITAFAKVLQEMPKDVFHEIIKDEFTVAQKVHDLLHLLVEKTQVCFGELFFGCQNRLEAVTTFLALLELVRLKEICFSQSGSFGDIAITRNRNHEKAKAGLDSTDSKEESSVPRTEEKTNS